MSFKVFMDAAKVFKALKWKKFDEISRCYESLQMTHILHIQIRKPSGELQIQNYSFSFLFLFYKAYMVFNEITQSDF